MITQPRLAGVGTEAKGGNIIKSFTLAITFTNIMSFNVSINIIFNTTITIITNGCPEGV